jgi:hypothetical protein
MKDRLREILQKAKAYYLKEKIHKNIPVSELCKNLGITKKEYDQYFGSKANLVKKLLQIEREAFMEIFDQYDFEGINAIDILMTVSKEMANRFREMTASISYSLRRLYPRIYQEHFSARSEFIFEKIQINLTKGINQGIYRDDLSIELLARLYISRLIDIHNPEFFPPDKFSFNTLFDVMIDSFIRSIANEKGLVYYEEKRKSLDFEI